MKVYRFVTRPIYRCSLRNNKLILINHEYSLIRLRVIDFRRIVYYVTECLPSENLHPLPPQPLPNLLTLLYQNYLFE